MSDAIEGMSRDQLFELIREEEARLREAIAPLEKREAELVAEIEELERPAKQLEEVRLQKLAARQFPADIISRAKNRIRTAMPAFLLNAISHCKTSGEKAEGQAISSLINATARGQQKALAQHFRMAEHSLEKLVSTNCDLETEVRKILAELHENEITVFMELEEKAEPTKARKRPIYAGHGEAVIE